MIGLQYSCTTKSRPLYVHSSCVEQQLPRTLRRVPPGQYQAKQSEFWIRRGETTLRLSLRVGCSLVVAVCQKKNRFSRFSGIKFSKKKKREQLPLLVEMIQQLLRLPPLAHNLSAQIQFQSLKQGLHAQQSSYPRGECELVISRPRSFAGIHKRYTHTSQYRKYNVSS